jgi:hypothetical protein
MNYAKVISIESKIECPHCKKMCYFSDTSLDDLTKEDPEGIICCHCNGRSCHMPDSYVKAMSCIRDIENEDDLYLVETKPNSYIHTIED